MNNYRKQLNIRKHLFLKPMVKGIMTPSISYESKSLGVFWEVFSGEHLENWRKQRKQNITNLFEQGLLTLLISYQSIGGILGGSWEVKA